MLRLKEQGYHLLLTFITTDDPEKNVDRVKMRYETGTTTGHFVPPDTVRERYHRTLALLPKAAEVADAVFVYDNSADFEKARLQAYIEQDEQFVVAPDAREWVRSRLVTPLQQREREFNAMTLMLEQQGHETMVADELRSAYKRPVILNSAYYVGQFDESTKKAVIHDRLMIDTAQHRKAGLPPNYAQHEMIVIQYSLANAPLVERHGRDLGAAPEPNVVKILKPKGPKI